LKRSESGNFKRGGKTTEGDFGLRGGGGETSKTFGGVKVGGENLIAAFNGMGETESFPKKNSVLEETWGKGSLWKVRRKKNREVTEESRSSLVPPGGELELKWKVREGRAAGRSVNTKNIAVKEPACHPFFAATITEIN